MKLEVMLFMNKINPEIGLSEDQLINFWKTLSTLPGTLKKFDKTTYGYRGLLLTGTEDCLTVFNEHVEVVSPSGIRWFIDSSRKLELWLLDIAKQIIPEDSMVTLIKPSFTKNEYNESYY